MNHSHLSCVLCSLVLCAGLLFGCGADAQVSGSSSSSSATEPTAGTKDGSSSTNQSVQTVSQSNDDAGFDAKAIAVALSSPDQNSILMLDDNTKELVRQLKAGKLPTSCKVLYDQMGALPTVEVSDPQTIAEIVGLAGRVNVVGPSNTSITDSYHNVWFKLEDGTEVGFAFEGAGNLVRRDGNLLVEGDGPLWLRVRELQGSQNKYEQTHAIAVLAGTDMVSECPEAAQEGDVVRITTSEVLDVMLKVSIPGVEVRQVGGLTYEFTMPNRQVAVYVTAEDYPGGGS